MTIRYADLAKFGLIPQQTQAAAAAAAASADAAAADADAAAAAAAAAQTAAAAADAAIVIGLPDSGGPKYVEVTVDTDMRPLHGTTSDGWLSVGSLEVISRFRAGAGTGLPNIAPAVAYGTYGDVIEATVDSNYRPVYLVTTTGLYYAHAGTLLQIAGGASGGALAADVAYGFDYTTATWLRSSSADATKLVYMIVTDGQSLALGSHDPAIGGNAVSTTAAHPGKALMFTAGPWPNGGSVATLVDLKENTGLNETACSGMADVIMSRLNARLGYKPTVIFAVAGRSGTKYAGLTGASEGLMRGSAQYNELMRLITAANSLVTASGARLVLLAHCREHGEQDYSDSLPQWLYQRALAQTALHINADAKAITGQTDDVRHLTYQTNRGPTAIGGENRAGLAQLAIEKQDSRYRCVGPIYFAEQSGVSHATSLSYRRIGRLFGHFITNDIFGAYEVALQAMRWWWHDATHIRLKYSKPLSIETTDALVTVSTLGAGKGVDFLDGPDETPTTSTTVSAIAIVAGLTDVLEVTLAAAPTGRNPRLMIGQRSTGSGGMGNVEGARTGIRSATAFDTDPFDSAPLYHWACVQTLNLS